MVGILTEQLVADWRTIYSLVFSISFRKIIFRAPNNYHVHYFIKYLILIESRGYTVLCFRYYSLLYSLTHCNITKKQNLKIANSNWLERLSSCFFHPSHFIRECISWRCCFVFNRRKICLTRKVCIIVNIFVSAKIDVWLGSEYKNKSCMNTLILRGHNLSSFLSLGFMTGNISSC